jgi:hypothetical protein
MKYLLGLAFLVAAIPAAARTDGELSGTWKFTTLNAMGNREVTSWLFKLETVDGKTTAKLANTYPPKAKFDLVSFDVAGDRVQLKIKQAAKGAPEQWFEGILSKDKKKIVGVGGSGTTVSAAYMAATDMTEISAEQYQAKPQIKPEELKSWAEVADKLLASINSQGRVDVNLQFALAFLAGKNYDLAIQHANAAEKALDNKSSQDLQAKVLQIAARVLGDAGRTAELRSVSTRLEKLEKVLDEEYMVKVPPFKGENFAGRKGDSKRAVTLELFTGAQCPPCVASDVAFDVLQKTYKPSELVLIQYHMHIPGPDPMTNPDTEARWKYYRDAYGAKAVSGTPTALFAGGSAKVGGGAMAAGEKLYEAYCKIIDPLLETPAACKISVSANRARDSVKIKTNVDGLEKPGKDAKLRILLVEESVRLLGSNKLRLHHQVVRSMPGGAEGVAMMNPTMAVNNEVDLKNLRKQLIKYLDDCDLNLRLPFPQVSRPLDMQHLRVIALVQDDSTHEILQAAQCDVIEAQ